MCVLMYMFGNLACLAILKSSDRMKQVCLWMTIYRDICIFIYIYIYIYRERERERERERCMHIYINVLMQIDECLCQLLSKINKNKNNTDISLYQIYLQKLHENILKYYRLNLFKKSP